MGPTLFRTDSYTLTWGEIEAVNLEKQGHFLLPAERTQRYGGIVHDSPESTQEILSKMRTLTRAVAAECPPKESL
jgi:hypothetical protein